MANTPRDQPAHIVLGVRWTPESGSTIVGLGSQIDDVEFQNAFGQGRVQPIPPFTYTPLELDGKQIGVITVPIEKDGPFTPIKDYTGLQAGAIYYRRGTKNDRAVGSEIQRIFSWFQNGGISLREEYRMDSWREFFDAVRGFEHETTYLLAVDRISSKAASPLYALGLPPWRAVIDFDPDSETSGLLNCVTGILEHRRVIHRITWGQDHMGPDPGTYWFFARGLSGRQASVSQGSHRDWLRSYKQELGRQLERVAGAVSPSPVVVVVFWSDVALRNHLRTLVEELHGAFGDAIEIVIVSEDEPSFAALAEEAETTFIRMSLRSLCNGVAAHYSDLQGKDDEQRILPSSSGAPVEIAPEDWLWLSEDIDFLHQSIGTTGEDDPREYRLGADVSWRNLHLRHDCERDMTPMVHSRVSADLERRQTVRINIYHAPGSGGTTLGRRIAWDFRSRFPVGILKHCTSHDTADRLAKVAALTENSVLVVVDGGQHSARDIDDLYEALKAGQTRAVVLQILRRFTPQQGGSRQFWLDASLSKAEADRFREVYASAVPEKRRQLTQLARGRDARLRNAFFFGLTAFGRDFRALSGYVRSRIAGLTNQQRRILGYIAIAHYYGQQSVPSQAFVSLLGLPRSKNLDFRAIFADSAAKALELLIENQHMEWRTAHHFVALEIMQQLFSPANSQEREAVWRQNLSRWGRDFANFCRQGGYPRSDRLLELVRRVFVYRDNVEVLGTERVAQQQFAQLVEDIPSSHGQIEVLTHLTECFPHEAHFHAHLGRLFSRNDEHDRALQCVDVALSIQPGDHVLHHMRGMILRESMTKNSGKGTSIDVLIDIAKKATESFEEARSLRPDQEHGYISEVQLIIYLVDQAGRSRRDVVGDVLARPETDPFLKRSLERAEDLLDRVHHLYAGEAPSRYVLACRARLQRFYGDYQRALQAWDSLLSRPEVAKPPIRRQIVWTLLRRHGSTWDALPNRAIDRIQRLLEDNLEEENQDSTSLRLWLRAIRQSRTPPSLDSVIEKVGYWKVNTGALDAAYYLYVLHTLRALNGSIQGKADAERALEECRAIARFRRDRTRSYEWIGSGDGISTLVHQSRLGDWGDNFWNSSEVLVRLSGRITSIGGPQKGTVELNGGVEAFFVPVKAGFHGSRDENLLVDCYLGFSYDGPRAWEVRRAGA